MANVIKNSSAAAAAAAAAAVPRHRLKKRGDDVVFSRFSRRLDGGGVVHSRVRVFVTLCS